MTRNNSVLMPGIQLRKGFEELLFVEKGVKRGLKRLFLSEESKVDKSIFL